MPLRSSWWLESVLVQLASPTYRKSLENYHGTEKESLAWKGVNHLPNLHVWVPAVKLFSSVWYAPGWCSCTCCTCWTCWISLPALLRKWTVWTLKAPHLPLACWDIQKRKHEVMRLVSLKMKQTLKFWKYLFLHIRVVESIEIKIPSWMCGPCIRRSGLVEDWIITQVM